MAGHEGLTEYEEYLQHKWALAEMSRVLHALRVLLSGTIFHLTGWQPSPGLVKTG